MKCTLKIECEISPDAPPELAEQCETRNGVLFAPPGTLVDDSNCWRLVLQGIAEAADEDCRLWTVQTDEQRAAMQQAAKRLAAGIDPDDFAAFDAGEMIGYDGDGNVVPGPNAKVEPEDDEEDE